LSDYFTTKDSYDVRAVRVEYDPGISVWRKTYELASYGITLVDTYSKTPTLQLGLTPITETDINFRRLLFVEIEVWDDDEWIDFPNNRFVLTRNQTEGTDRAQMYEWAGIGYNDFIIQRNRLESHGVADREWIQKSPGWILSTFVSEAVARGWGNDFVTEWTNTNDSKSDPWAAGLIDRKYRINTPLSQVLDGMVDDGLVEYHSEYNENVFKAGALRVTNPGYGLDWSLPASDPVINLSDAELLNSPDKNSFEESFSRIFAQGDGALLRAKSLPIAGTYYEGMGHLEGGVQASGVDKEADLDVIAQNALNDSFLPKGEFSYKFNAVTSPRHLRPYIHYNSGHYVLARGLAEPERFRIMQIQLDKTGNNVTATVIVGELFDKSEGKLAKAASKAVAGSSSSGGGGTVPSPADQRIPAVPTGFTATPTGYWDPDGAAKTATLFDWDEVTTATNGDTLPIDHYDLIWRTGPFDPWGSLGISYDTDLLEYDMTPGRSYDVRVRAVSAAGVSGDWADVALTTTNPGVTLGAPSTPVLTQNAGVVSAEWDGLIGGFAPPPEFKYLQVNVSDVASVGPYDSSGQQLESAGSASLTPGPGVTIFVKFNGVDRLGNVGPSSAWASITADVFDDGYFHDLATALLDAELDVIALQDDLDDAEADIAAAQADIIAAQADADAAAAAASGAQATANGRNRVFYQNVSPSTPIGYNNGDLWFVVSGGIVTEEWHYLSGAWNQVTLGNQVIANLDAGKITTGFLAAARIDAGTIIATMIAAGAITTAKIAAGAVTTTELAAGAVTAVKIAAGTITANEIATGAITAAKILAGAIDGMLITGATIRTSGSNPRVELDSTNGLRAFNGAGVIKAQITTGGVLTADGATITGLLRSASSGERFELNGTQLKFFSTNGGSGYLYANDDGSPSGLQLGIQTGLGDVKFGKTTLPAGGNAYVYTNDGGFFGDLYVTDMYQPSENNRDLSFSVMSALTVYASGWGGHASMPVQISKGAGRIDLDGSFVNTATKTIASGTSTTVATLPLAWRPDVERVFLMECNLANPFCRVSIKANGNIDVTWFTAISGVGANGMRVSLSGCSWRVPV